MVIVSEQRIEEMRNTLNYYVRKVNEERLHENFNLANDYLDMLLGALSIYNILVTDPLEVKEYNGEIELIDKYVRR